MKAPKQQKRYCPYCKKHTEHKVSIHKNKGRPAVKLGALKRGTRHVAEIFAGYGGSARRIGKPAKTTKKIGLKFQCSVCNKLHYKQNPIRLKKLELI